jgi:hypothetical protein
MRRFLITDHAMLHCAKHIVQPSVEVSVESIINIDLIEDVNLQHSIMVHLMEHCDNSCDAWRKGLVLVLDQGLLWVCNVNEERQVDSLTKSTMALVIGDVRIMRCQLCKQRDEDTVIPICCIGH